MTQYIMFIILFVLNKILILKGCKKNTFISYKSCFFTLFYNFKTIYLFNNMIHFETFIYFQNQYNQTYKMIYFFNDNIWSF